MGGGRHLSCPKGFSGHPPRSNTHRYSSLSRVDPWACDGCEGRKTVVKGIRSGSPGSDPSSPSSVSSSPEFDGSVSEGGPDPYLPVTTVCTTVKTRPALQGRSVQGLLCGCRLSTRVRGVA